MFEEPKDMFAETDQSSAMPPQPPQPSVAPGAPEPVAPLAPPPSNLPLSESFTPSAGVGGVSSGGGVLRIVVIVVVLLGIAGVSGFFAYRIMTQPSSSGVVDSVSDSGVIDVEDTTKHEDAVTEDVAPVPLETQTSNPATLLDSDGDGLTNARELELQTSVSKADTDGDGLGDREEVEVYGTDPRNPDTDGDGYLDGQEVSSGYNPNGDGKLFAVPSGS